MAVIITGWLNLLITTYATIWRNNDMPESIKRWVNKWINTAKISLTAAN